MTVVVVIKNSCPWQRLLSQASVAAANAVWVDGFLSASQHSILYPVVSAVIARRLSHGAGFEFYYNCPVVNTFVKPNAHLMATRDYVVVEAY